MFFSIPKPVIRSNSDTKGIRNLNNFQTTEFYFKFPRENQSNLIKEFFATRVAAALVKAVNFDVIIPSVSVILQCPENSAIAEPCLRITMIQNYSNLEKPKAEFSIDKYAMPLLQCLIIDLLVGNIDGHKKNLSLDVQNQLTHIDFDRAFQLKNYNPIEKNIEQIANALRDGFIQRQLIKTSAFNQLLAGIKYMPNLRNIIIKCLTTAAKELKSVNEIDADAVDSELTAATDYMIQQLQKLQEYKPSAKIAPLLVPSTPCKGSRQKEFLGRATKLQFFEDCEIPEDSGKRKFDSFEAEKSSNNSDDLNPLDLDTLATHPSKKLRDSKYQPPTLISSFTY